MRNSKRISFYFNIQWPAPKPARKFLGQCLDGIVASSYQFYELIVVDDGSTDDSAEISR